MLRKPADQLDRADAQCYASVMSLFVYSGRRGYTASMAAAGFGFGDFVRVWAGTDPMVSRKKMPTDAVPRKMISLLVDLLRTGELPGLARSSAWHMLAAECCTGRQHLLAELPGCGIFDMVVSELQTIGAPAEWLRWWPSAGGGSGPLPGLPGEMLLLVSEGQSANFKRSAELAKMCRTQNRQNSDAHLTGKMSGRTSLYNLYNSSIARTLRPF
jgi:hypothetical protein